MNARIDPASLTSPELRFAMTASGANIPFVARGEGEPLLFVHGSLCDYRYWDAQSAILSKQFHCIALSLGHYWPGATRSYGPFTWMAHVEEVAELINALGVGPVHLVGHSRGGCVAFHVARLYPHLVKTLTLADPGGPLQIEGKSPAALPAATLALRAQVAELIEAGDIDGGLEKFVDSVSMPGYWRKSPQGFRRMAIDNAGTLPLQFRDHLPAYEAKSAREVRCTTLLIEGEKSPMMYRHNVAQLGEWMGDARKQTIANASHGMNVANPAAFNRTLQAFLASA